MTEPNLYRYSVKLVREKATEPIGSSVRGPADVHHIARTILDDEPQEVFLAFYLDARHRVRGWREVSRGTLDASLIHPREVFQGALLANAASVILAHNHPSGDPSPSAEDRAVTRQLAKAGQTIGVPVLDHIVVGAGSGTYTSLAPEIVT